MAGDEPANAAPPAGTGAPVPAGGVRVGLALSGGGFRAAAFHLGVLKRLEELNVLPRVETLSTVSGGSITGALYALRCAQQGEGRPGGYTVESLISEMRPVLTRNLRSRALFGTPWRGLRTLASVLSRRISRVGLMVEELDRLVFAGATLSELPPWIVINATNLRTGKAWKFYHDAAGDYFVGATTETSRIRVTEAVAASAAYPGLTDSYAFRTRWERLRGDALDGRWQRPEPENPGEISRWRTQYGHRDGAVAFPLVDGGLYDNEGMTGLRGTGVTHAILSGVTPTERDDATGFGPMRYLRLVEVVHDRLGGATRMLTHELTHGTHPETAAREAEALASDLRVLASDPTLSPTAGPRLATLAARAQAVAAVGTPSRGHQFTASAQVLLHRTELAKNKFRGVDGGAVDVPAEYRGLPPDLVVALSRVRTDLDALEPEVLDLLIAQGYFLTDALIKLSMPDLLALPASQRDWYAAPWAPAWAFAHDTIAAAHRDVGATIKILERAGSRQGVLGRVHAPHERRKYIAVLALTGAVATLGGLALLAGADALSHGLLGLIRRGVAVTHERWTHPLMAYAVAAFKSLLGLLLDL